eukprot:TRINITY_DN11510_c1_g1_i5.p1 TRINITY_DN11510_c1_g1~~TRINITY_DN11510_c1_g1_i5.p1  ORF type:complete len:344 (+),score=57.10 TRINITY_DN11510_c1_g1_i5:129-1160(+)
MISCRRLITSSNQFGSVLRNKSVTPSKAHVSSQALFFSEFGEPNTVISCQESTINDAPLKSNQVKIQMKAAPINPSDVFTIKGVYPLKPELPGVAGHEGVGEVIERGSDVSQLSVGDLVVPVASAQGTYRAQGIFDAQGWHKVASDLPLECASTLTINPPTALGMLESFVDLQEGDVIVQNGATGSVGKNIIQLCKAKNLKSINIIRQRPDMQTTIHDLHQLGATLVSTEDKVRDDFKKSGLDVPKLAINCVGGESAVVMAKMLVQGGTHVTYGALAGGNLSMSPALLIYKDVKFCGFWISGGYARKLGPEGKAALIDRCAEYMKQGILRPSDWQMILTLLLS